MSAYTDLVFLKLVSSMPSEDIDDLETRYPGIVDATVNAVSRLFDAKLSKRYATPFGFEAGTFSVARVPEAVKWQVSAVVTYQLMLKRGWNPSSAQDELIVKNRDEALAWLNEAANAETGLVDLPKREAPPPADASGVAKGGPKSYSEQSPYTWTTLQRADARREDRTRYR